MTNKFMSRKYSASKVESDTPPITEKEKTYKRDESDNKLFKSIQVKDITPYITEDCVGVWDFDTPVWKACANMETKSIRVKHKTEDVIADMQNVTAFRGRGNKISENSWLGMKNLDRSLEGLEPWKVEDFDIEEVQTLKYDSYEKTLEQAKVQIYLKLKQVRQQYRLPRIKVVLGEGDNFRHELDQVRLYKGERKKVARPLILKDIRKWVMEELDSEMAGKRFDGKNTEADDVVEFYGSKGYINYRQTGKFNYVCVLTDKDGNNNPKMLINPDTHTGEHNPLKGKFKFPQAMLIEATDKSCGDVEMVTKADGADFKFYGFKGLLWQAFLSGDSADNYNMLSHLPYKLNFGDKSAYAVLKPCKTAQEALQKTIDTVAEILPYGVQYTTHDGRELDVDTMTYMNTYFLTAYMMRSYNDRMDFYKLCEAMKVDTSKIVDNNLLTPPKRVFVGNEGHLLEIEKLLNSIVKDDMKGCKQLKSKEKDAVFDTIKEKLTSINFESHYDWKQFEKSSGKSVQATNPKRRSLKDFLIEKGEFEKGGEIDEQVLMEVFDCQRSVRIWEGDVDRHSWYNIVECINKVVIDGEDRFFKGWFYDITGDNCASDMDLDLPTIDDYCEVYPVEKMVTVYE